MFVAPGVGLEPTNLAVNSRLLCQLSYPGLAAADVTAVTNPITRQHAGADDYGRPRAVYSASRNSRSR